LTEDQLKKLMVCLVDKFELTHQAQTSKLQEHIFYVTEDRFGCAKAAGLNSQKQVTDEHGESVKMLCSSYAKAITELVHRGHLAFCDNSHLRFVITVSGLQATKELIKPTPITTPLERLRKCLNGNQGPLATIGIIVAIIAIFAAWQLAK
jgi:hypothetical protein